MKQRLIRQHRIRPLRILQRFLHHEMLQDIRRLPPRQPRRTRNQSMRDRPRIFRHGLRYRRVLPQEMADIIFLDLIDIDGAVYHDRHRIVFGNADRHSFRRFPGALHRRRQIFFFENNRLLRAVRGRCRLYGLLGCHRRLRHRTADRRFFFIKIKRRRARLWQFLRDIAEKRLYFSRHAIARKRNMVRLGTVLAHRLRAPRAFLPKQKGAHAEKSQQNGCHNKYHKVNRKHTLILPSILHDNFSYGIIIRRNLQENRHILTYNEASSFTIFLKYLLPKHLKRRLYETIGNGRGTFLG